MVDNKFDWSEVDSFVPVKNRPTEITVSEVAFNDVYNACMLLANQVKDINYFWKHFVNNHFQNGLSTTHGIINDGPVGYKVLGRMHGSPVGVLALYTDTGSSHIVVENGRIADREIEDAIYKAFSTITLYPCTSLMIFVSSDFFESDISLFCVDIVNKKIKIEGSKLNSFMHSFIMRASDALLDTCLKMQACDKNIFCLDHTSFLKSSNYSQLSTNLIYGLIGKFSGGPNGK